jgi:hypothetical protein
VIIATVWQINLLLSGFLIWIWQVQLCQIVGDELFFFTWHIFLEVGKAQDLPSKIWQTLGDALIRVSFDVICS